ncbi:MAG: TIGR04255 family protein [Rhodospirillales bacterium]|nr:TIGR04255 family protein [Rhodospirillales bacterium]
MDRPAHLPIYERPPLNEVVYGVQFTAPPDFTSVQHRDIWELFQPEFPNVEEQTALAPAFETFGGAPSPMSLQFQFGGAPKTRLWFISRDETHLLQFQDDRLLLNWRRRENGNDYPHFEGIFPVFAKSLQTLSEWFRSNGHELQVNQAEVTYINLISAPDLSTAQDWFTFLNTTPLKLEVASLTLTEVLNNEMGKPIARFFHEVVTVATPGSRERAFRFTLTIRGAPQNGSLEAAFDFIKGARERIDVRFAELTTESAKTFWGRK